MPQWHSGKPDDDNAPHSCVRATCPSCQVGDWNRLGPLPGTHRPQQLAPYCSGEISFSFFFKSPCCFNVGLRSPIRAVRAPRTVPRPSPHGASRLGPAAGKASLKGGVPLGPPPAGLCPHRPAQGSGGGVFKGSRGTKEAPAPGFRTHLSSPHTPARRP